MLFFSTTSRETRKWIFGIQLYFNPTGRFMDIHQLSCELYIYCGQKLQDIDYQLRLAALNVICTCTSLGRTRMKDWSPLTQLTGNSACGLLLFCFLFKRRQHLQEHINVHFQGTPNFIFLDKYKNVHSYVPTSPVVFVFKFVVFVLEEEIDLLQQHMAIQSSTSCKLCQL